tara:strand:+ start:185 stop:811 length:627 start_codon:yes stop_codon:yes gene_type:complete
MIKGAKICGVSNLETLKYTINHPYPPKFIGFISNYKKSKRYVDINFLAKLNNYKNNKIYFVSVLVNPDDHILEKIKNFQLDYYQLYNVSPQRTKMIKKKYNKKIITALNISDKEDINQYKLYENISDIILFDGKGYEKSIGFDHTHLNDIPKNITIMIAGNIKFDNIPIIKELDYIIDLSGSLENDKGDKDLKKIDYFLNNIKQYEIN